jgi:hypothetical protein
MNQLRRYTCNRSLHDQVEDPMYTDELVPAVARQLLDGLLALKRGDFSVRMPFSSDRHRWKDRGLL